MKLKKHFWSRICCAAIVAAISAVPTVTTASQVEAASNDAAVQVWLTDVPSNTWLARQNDVAMVPKQADSALTIAVDSSRQYQSILGFGAAMTDSSGWLIGTKMSEKQRDQLMTNLFSPTKGIGLSLIRDPMGATDLSAHGDYSYDDLPAGQTDPALEHFSIQHDTAYIIPLLKQARALNASAKIMANPWSPPGWMKTSGSMVGGTLLPEYHSAFANYFVKFIQAYEAEGVPVDFVSLQNEPAYSPPYPGMVLSADQAQQLIQNMGQAFEANGIGTQIIGWDHNWDMPLYPEQFYSDPATSPYVAATGWHCYAGNVTTQSLVHNDYPGKGALITECGGGTWQATTQGAFRDEVVGLVINGIRNWAQGVILWNLALDPDHGPVNEDCQVCTGVNRGLVTVDPASGNVTYNLDYYALAHASKFVRAGARRIYSNSFGKGSIDNVAFQNPDGSKVLVAFNDSSDTKTFSVADGTRSFNYTLNAGDAVTFKWAGPPENGRHEPAASVPADPTHDFIFGGSGGASSEPIIVTYDPAFISEHNAINSGGKLVTYSMPYGATIQTDGSGTAMPRDAWTVSAISTPPWDNVVNAIDGNLNTRWSSGHGMTNGDWFELNLGSTQTFNRIVLDTGPSSAGDYIRKYQVYVSSDGVDWGAAVVNGTGTGQIVSIPMPVQSAQYIRIVNLGSAGSWWSISDLNVYEPTGISGSGTISGPSAVPPGLQVQSWTSDTGTLVTLVYNGTGNKETFPISTDGFMTYSLPSGASAMFTITDETNLPQPVFGGMTPTSGIANQTVTISGSNFGPDQGHGTITMGGYPVHINNWSDNSLSFLVPSGLPNGSVDVMVNNKNGIYAGAETFTLQVLEPLDRTGWSATASNVSSNDPTANLLDGNLNTRYSSGTGQAPGMWIEVDMGATQTFNKVVLDSGSTKGDYSANSDVYVSNDGTNWTEVAQAISNGPVVVVSFPTQTARYIKVLNQSSSGSWWSIEEFYVVND